MPHMFSNKQLNSIVAELFIRGRKLISLVFITKSCFAVRFFNENSKQKRTSTN